MIILRDSIGSLTIKRKIDDADHVRLGIFEVRHWIDGEPRRIAKMTKPPGEFSIDELGDMYDELLELGG